MFQAPELKERNFGEFQVILVDRMKLSVMMRRVFRVTGILNYLVRRKLEKFEMTLVRVFLASLVKVQRMCTIASFHTLKNIYYHTSKQEEMYLCLLMGLRYVH